MTLRNTLQLFIMSLPLLAALGQAEEAGHDPHHEHDHALEVVVVTGSLDSLPGDHVHSGGYLDFTPKSARIEETGNSSMTPRPPSASTSGAGTGAS